MLFKKRCSVCGARNSKERIVCIECSAPLDSEQVKRQLQHVSSGPKAPVETVTEKGPKVSIDDVYRDDKKVLYKISISKFFLLVKSDEVKYASILYSCVYQRFFFCCT